MNSPIDVTLQAHVDGQLLTQGAFTPLEYLIESGRLSYTDYESWRRREIEFLDDVLMGSRARVLAEIEQAVLYAREIRLVEQIQEFQAWSQNAAPLRASADGKVHRLLAARYVPAQSAPQMDLFFDNPVVALTNGIVRALTTRRVAEARQQLDRLYTLAPNHADLASFDRLLGALEHVGQEIAEPRAEIEFLLEVTPTAKRLLGLEARDMLAPLWRQVADALANRTFVPDEPNVHPSFALTQAQDWRAVSACVLGDPAWPQHPTLCLRLAHSSFFLRRRNEALMAWCHLCWRSPAQAAEELDSRRQADSEIAGWWQQFLDLEESADDDAVLTATDFPAWLLLRQPDLTRLLPADLPTAETPGEAHYRCVHRLIEARLTGRSDDEITQRRTLQTTQPALFAYLKRTVAVGPGRAPRA
jgi:hypothetical protein